MARNSGTRRRRSSRRRSKQRGGAPSDPVIRAAAGQSFVIGDIDFLYGEEGADAIHGYRKAAGVFKAQGVYEILFIKRPNDVYPFRNGRRNCFVSTSGILALMTAVDYETLGGSPQNALANNILEFIAPENGIIATRPSGFTFNGQLLC